MSMSPDVRTTRAILVADDEEHVRSLLGRVLGHAGYIVITARDGRAALEVIADLARPIDLLLTDASMPLLAGPELIREARKLRPDLKVICLSAHVHDRYVGDGIHYLPKPFALAGVLQKVSELLC